MEYVILMLDHYYLIFQKFASSYHYKLPRSMSCPSKVYRSKYNMFMEYGVSKGIYPKYIWDGPCSSEVTPQVLFGENAVVR